MNLGRYWLRWATRGADWVRMRITSLLRSLQQKRMAWGWVYPSAAHLSKPMTAGSGPRPTLPTHKFQLFEVQNYLLRPAANLRLQFLQVLGLKAATQP